MAVAMPQPCRLRPTAQEAEHAYRHVPRWLSAVRADQARCVVLDLAEAKRLDFSAFGTLLTRLRADGVQVRLVNAPGHLVESLRALGVIDSVIDGVTVAEPGAPEGNREARPTPARAAA
ncbi:hypothetical protein C3Y87_15155 [Carbonactinospora thermoautotrophica]|uniref:STAS domain-containing protein n=1 Tax=Carbonactinospora thermoautotrophica TaxID=1469144 RepID=UPI00227103D4|nr:STAS domain-containing protein [Carbonactinospora thermoautotrophica]MCX9192724.1 hypothetical protein [Carbonactinospora thermoautotrophica]